MLRMGDYARKYGVSTRTVYNWIRAEKIKFKRIGSTVFILDGEPEPSQIDRIERKLDDVLHFVRKAQGNGA